MSQRPAGFGPDAGEGAAELPASAAQITPDWLTRALRPYLGEARVIEATLAPVGGAQGFSGSALFRISLCLDRPVLQMPHTLVAKLSPGAGAMRRLMSAANGREVRFYRDFAPVSPGAAPDCLYAAFDPDSGASVLLLQDLGEDRFVPFAQGCAGDVAAAVVRAMADLHVHGWNNPGLASLGPVGIPGDGDFGPLWAEYPARLRALLPGTQIAPSVRRLGDAMASGDVPVRSALAEGPFTLLHGDLQTDNLVLGDAGPEFLDWQFCGAGPGPWDLAYFLISSLEPPVRRAAEAGLLALYHDRLRASGGIGYDFVACCAEYLRGAARKLAVTVAATVLFDNAGAARAAWRETDLRRLTAFCDDHFPAHSPLRKS